MLTLALLGCSFPDKPGDTATPGDDTGADTNGTGSGAYACVEVSSTPITDTSVAALGMTLSPDEAVLDWGGTWQGTFVFTAGNEELAAFTLDAGGTWELVERELRGGGGGTEMGTAPVEECSNSYRWTTMVDVSDATSTLLELAEAEVEIPDASYATWSASVDLADVAGSTVPSWDPADWSSNVLMFYGSGEPGVWHVSVNWLGTNEAFASVDTGTATVSGQTEGVASGDFVPAEE